MATRQYNVNLSFNADVNQAKAQIQSLAKSLQDIAKMPGNASSLFDDIGIKKASKAALELQQHLSKAVNLDTGKLDLSRFSSSLKASGRDLNSYCDTLLSTGEKGQQAFLKLAQAIATADTPVTRVNKKLVEMGTVLKNTIRWQISSSAVHGFSGAVQSAYGYAQNLNKSLNDIRIVTGQNVDQMSKFAAEANKAARALSATTTDYTNASLIYYQQGLTDAEVAERTAITIKMANAAGVSAQTASDQLTAVWNNFNDGSKSLEYYADVMTALGAATASSTDEISAGLNKFSAVAQTVGLSYEYATAALATITSNTRESADIVGNALKTLFARIQGLQLGETLEDGTNLNKYSEALSKVGISIYETNGDLKAMDKILDEMAAKWENLSKVQQTALAQTVAGVRQYNQLVALMENWHANDADSMITNLNTAYNSSGALQEQADIYAESWEAASDRVRAAAEHIYSSLINDEFFIDLLSGFEKVLEVIGGIVDGLGGLKGIIGSVGSVFLTAFAKEMPEVLDNLQQNFMVFTGKSKKVMRDVQSELNIKLAEQQANPALSESYKIQLEGMSAVNAMKSKLVLASRELSSQEQKEYEIKIKNVQEMYKEAAALAEKKNAAEQLSKIATRAANGGAMRASRDVFNSYNTQQDKITSLEDKATDPASSENATKRYTQALTEAKQEAIELELQIEKVKEAYALTDDEVDVLIGTNTDQSLLADTQQKIANKVKETTMAFTDQIKQYSNLQNIDISVTEQANAWKKVAHNIKDAEAAGNTKNLSKHVDAMRQKMQQYLIVLQKVSRDNGIKLSGTMIESMSASIDELDVDNIEQVTEKFGKFAQVVSRKANAALSTLEISIEDLREDMVSMKFNNDELKDMEQAAERAATATQDLNNSMANINGVADENIDSTFKLSTALTDFGSTVMSVSSLVTSLQNAFSLIGKDGATGFEVMGAMISTIIPLLTTYNSLQSLTSSLTQANYVKQLLAAKGYKMVTLESGALAVAKVAETGAIISNTAAWYANPILWIALAIAGVVAALAILVATVKGLSKAISDAYNADAIAAEKAEAAAKKLGEAYNEVKQEYQDMIAAMEEYQSAKDALGELTKGTEEYREALKEANRQALKLIDSYGLIEGTDFTTHNGEILINESSLDRVRTEKERKADIAYTASQMSEIQAKEARATANQTELGRSIGYGQVVDNIIEKLETNPNLLNSKEALATAIYSTEDSGLVNTLWDNRDSIQQLRSDKDAVEQSKRLAAQNAANEIMSGLEYDKTKSGQMALEAGGRIYQQISGDFYDKYLAEAEDRFIGARTKSSKEAFEDYAEYSGLNQLKGFKATNYKSDGTIEYRYIDDNGEEQSKVATAEEIAATLAAADAADALEKSLSALNVEINTLNLSDNKADQALASFISKGNLEGATKGEYDSIASEIGDITNDADIEAYLTKKFGNLDEAATKYGYADAGSMIQAMKTSLEIEWEIPSGTADDIADKLTLGAAQKIQRAYEEMGEQGGQAFVQTINTVASSANWDSLPLEYQTALLDDIANIDWSSWDAGERAIAIAEEYGVAIDGTTEAWQNSVNAMRDAANALPDIYLMRQELEQVKEISSDINVGDILNKEDYSILEQYNKELAKYFTILSDGSAQFTGDKLDFQQTIKSLQTKDLLDAAQLYKDRNSEIVNAINSGVDDNGNPIGDIGILAAEMQENKASIQRLMNELALNAEDANERAELLKAGSIDAGTYGSAVMSAHNEEKWKDMDPEEVEKYADALKEAADNSELLFDNMTEEAAEDVALYTKKMNQGVKKLADDFEDWSDILKKSDKSSEEYADAMSNVKDAMSDVLGVSEEFLSDDFILKNMEDIKKAAEGDAEAIDRLAVAASKDILINLNIQDEGVQAQVMSLHDELVADIPDIEVGTTLTGTEEFLQKARDIVATAGMTAEQANAYFRSMGFEAKFKTEEKPIEQRVPITYTKSSVVERGIDEVTGAPYYTTATSSWQDGYDTFTGKVDVMAMSTDGSTPKIDSLTKTNSGAMNNSSKSNPGGKKSSGGGGSKKKAEKPKKSDIVERYKEVNDLLDDVADAMEDASKAADRLYGKSRLDLMQKNNDLLKQEIELTKQKKEEALKYLDEDLDAMFKAASDAGVILTTDENGLITNYTEAMTKLYNELDAEVTKANKDGNADENEQARIDNIQKRVDALKEAMAQYDETRELIEDLDNQLDEKLYEWQDKNYEMLTYKLEIQLELNDDDMKMIDYYLNKVSDNFFQMAEAAALMTSALDSALGTSQWDIYTTNLANYEKHLNSLKDSYDKGEISQADYVEGLREAQDGIISNLSSLNELDKTMMKYYGDTLNMAIDEVAKYTDHMDHLNEVLEHYQSLMDIMGKSADYKTIGTILEARAKVLGDQVATAKTAMDMYKNEADDRYAAYQQALLDGDKAAAELYLKQYEDALAAADKAEQEYLSRAEEWAESLTEILQNKLSQAGQTLENALTGGTSFDQLTTEMERAASLQEEYLTTTNKIYETNKLMRKAQQELDKSTNAMAKQRLRDFIKETNELQNQTKLSNYELEIQQAKYDLLLAQIALEEAQNAKSIVRLQRDSEGNFGYVYTADENAVNQAEQDVLDKENNLYNIALQGANEYSEKYIQTLNEMYDTLADLQQQHLEGAFESEDEYHAAVEAAKQYYYDKLKQYSELHAIALTTDNRVITEAWSSGINDMVVQTEYFINEVENYLQDAEIAFTEWANMMSNIATDVGVDMSALGEKVQNIVSNSDKLSDIIIDKIIPAVDKEIESVKDITSKYSTLREELSKVKTSYESIIKAINDTIKAQSNLSSSVNSTTTNYASNSGGSNNASNTGGGGNGGSSGGSSNPNKPKQPSTPEATVTLYSNPYGAGGAKATFKKGKFDAVFHSFGNTHGFPYVITATDDKGKTGWITQKDYNTLTSLDTGGYTGHWGPYGKLAMLHEKELILNKDDTENFLASMGILERILQVIDLQSMSSQLGGILSSPMLGVTNNPNLEQNVHIEASFPNATNHNEIEEAFNNLINTASQYANRK